MAGNPSVHAWMIASLISNGEPTRLIEEGELENTTSGCEAQKIIGRENLEDVRCRG